MKRAQAFDQDMGRSGNYEERRTDSSTFKFHSHELQLVNSDKADVRWILGVFYSKERNNIVYAIDQADNDGHGDHSQITSFISDDPGAAVAFFVQPDRSVQSQAIFTQETFDLNDVSVMTGITLLQRRPHILLAQTLGTSPGEGNEPPGTEAKVPSPVP